MPALSLAPQPEISRAVAAARALEADLNGAFFERRAEVRGLLVALVAGEHVLLLGPPGTAKSALTQALAGALTGASYFQVLMTRFTVPEEVFGPISLAGLERDEYRRVTAGYLPTATVAFLDEALALDTPVPIPNGWSSIGELHPGDQVFGSDGRLTTVRRLTEIAVDHECFRVVLRDGEHIVADAGHLWKARPVQGRRPFETWTTKAMVEDGRAFCLAPAEPVELPAATLPIDPYALGVWLGNGNCWTGEVAVRPEWVDATVRQFDRAGYCASKVVDANERGTLRTIRFAGSGFRTDLADAGLIVRKGSEYTGSNKFVPPAYLRGSIHQRISLLRGLMDTDGFMDKSGTCIFSNTNESIVDAVVEIVRSFGIRASKIATKDERLGRTGKPHRTCWKVTFRAVPSLNPFLARNVEIPPTKHQRWTRIERFERVDPVPVRCVEVEAADHLFLVGRSFAVTHNCFKANSSILNAMLTALNERAFDDGGTRSAIPLELCVGASNELPKDDALDALYDRFMVRFWTGYVKSRDNLRSLLVQSGAPRVTATISTDDLRILRDLAAMVDVDPVADLVLDLRDKLSREAGVECSDRRWRKAMTLIRASAALDGRTVAEPRDLRVLADSLWRAPDERPAVSRIVMDAVSPALGEAQRLLDAAAEQATKVVPGATGAEATTTASRVNAELRKVLADAERLPGDVGVADLVDRIRSMQREVARTAAKLLGL